MERQSPETSVSVHLSASAPSPLPVHRALPSDTSLLSRKKNHLFFFFFFTSHDFFLPVPPLIQHVSLRPGPSPWRALLALPGNIFQIQSVAQVEVLSCSFLLLGRPPTPQHPASVSRNHSVLSWSLSCVEALTVEASSVLTAAASGSKLWHLPTTSPPVHPAFLSIPTPAPLRDPAHPTGAPTERLNGCALSQRHVTWCFHNNGEGQKITEAGVDTCFTKQVQ